MIVISDDEGDILVPVSERYVFQVLFKEFQ